MAEVEERQRKLATLAESALTEVRFLLCWLRSLLVLLPSVSIISGPFQLCWVSIVIRHHVRILRCANLCN